MRPPSRQHVLRRAPVVLHAPREARALDPLEPPVRRPEARRAPEGPRPRPEVRERGDRAAPAQELRLRVEEPLHAPLVDGVELGRLDVEHAYAAQEAAPVQLAAEGRGDAPAARALPAVPVEVARDGKDEGGAEAAGVPPERAGEAFVVVLVGGMIVLFGFCVHADGDGAGERGRAGRLPAAVGGIGSALARGAACFGGVDLGRRGGFLGRWHVTSCGQRVLEWRRLEGGRREHGEGTSLRVVVARLVNDRALAVGGDFSLRTSNDKRVGVVVKSICDVVISKTSQ